MFDIHAKIVIYNVKTAEYFGKCSSMFVHVY